MAALGITVAVWLFIRQRKQKRQMRQFEETTIARPLSPTASPSVKKGMRSSKMRERQPEVTSCSLPPETFGTPGQITVVALEDEEDSDGLSESSQPEQENTLDPPANIDDVPVLRAQLSAALQRLAILETQPPPEYVSSYGSERI
ncbi:hypothetical protein V5O48_011719 [Marasmius crinis-equi]|uniref:Uncharacterized protein n=1 Tax=Marasmius crinis-equi TaxID=585013 RepID=A0ABR3F4T3_9AGAR